MGKDIGEACLQGSIKINGMKQKIENACRERTTVIVGEFNLQINQLNQISSNTLEEVLIHLYANWGNRPS